MLRIRIVLVEPKYDGNIGSIARAMKNFGLKNLTMVNPCSIGYEARRMAMHGNDILDTAIISESLDAVMDGSDLIVGTTGIDTKNEKKFLRIPITPREFAERIRELDGEVAVLFGREDYGLHTSELRRCDMLVTIPTSSSYPVLNVAQAAVIIFYELFQLHPLPKRRKASAFEKEKLHDAFAELLNATNYPQHKIDRTKTMFRRMIGRAAPSKWEFHATMGALTRATRRIKRLETDRSDSKTK